MSFKIYRLIFWLFIAAALVISFFPLFGKLSDVQAGVGVFSIRLDYLLHALGYFLLCMYYLAGHCLGLKLFNTYSLARFVAVMVLLAVGTEIVQLWVPERTFNPLDLVANASGVALGVLVIGVCLLRTK